MAATPAPSMPSFRSNAVCRRSLATPRARHSSHRRSKSALAASTAATEDCCICEAYAERWRRRCLKLHRINRRAREQYEAVELLFGTFALRECAIEDSRRDDLPIPSMSACAEEPIPRNTNVNMSARHSLSTVTPQDVCPRCKAPGGAQSLLTSMTRYYVCRQCACRWHVDRKTEQETALTPDRLGAAD
jgi:hypothetical protein